MIGLAVASVTIIAAIRLVPAHQAIQLDARSKMMRVADRGARLRPITSPVSGSAYLASAQAEWQPTDTERFWIKPLYEDAAKGEKTLLMKVDPGAYSPLHAHEEFEQFYVLEGSLYDQEQVMNAGDYVCRAAGAMHSAGSDTGAIVLLIYTKAAPLNRS